MPEIALPTRTWVAPNRIATSKSALMPIDSSARPLRRRDLGEEREMRRGRLVGRRDAHQAVDGEAVFVAAGGEEGVGFAGSTPAFCGSSPVLTWTNRSGRRPCRAISFASAAADAAGRACGWRRTGHRLLRLVGLQRPDQMQLEAGMALPSAGHLASASCTWFSPNTRWPAAITGTIASAAKVLDTGDEGHSGGIAARVAAQASAISRRTAARPAVRIGEEVPCSSLAIRSLVVARKPRRGDDRWRNPLEPPISLF